VDDLQLLNDFVIEKEKNQYKIQSCIYQ